jgi:hypothetical protein
MKKIYLSALLPILAGCSGPREATPVPRYTSASSTQPRAKSDTAAYIATFNAQSDSMTRAARAGGGDQVLARLVSVVLPDVSDKYAGQSVIIHAVVGTDGHLWNITGLEALDANTQQSVVTALKQWVFTPAKIDGREVNLRVDLPLFL